MILHFSGIVAIGDNARTGAVEPDCSVTVGGVDVVAAVGEAAWGGPVTVAIADERFSGDLETGFGWGYSEWTPMEGDKLRIGPHDIIAILEGMEGQAVDVWIADEPANVLGRSQGLDRQA